MDGLCCQGNIENCNAEEFECRCGVYACEIHGHIEDEWECPNESGPVICRDDFVCDVGLAVKWRGNGKQNA